MVNQLLELLGMCLLVAFAYLLFPPAALAVAGVLLILVANMRAIRASTSKGDS